MEPTFREVYLLCANMEECSQTQEGSSSPMGPNGIGRTSTRDTTEDSRADEQPDIEMAKRGQRSSEQQQRIICYWNARAFQKKRQSDDSIDHKRICLHDKVNNDVQMVNPLLLQRMTRWGTP